MSLGTLDILPADVANIVFHNLDAESLQNAELVSATFRSRLRSDELWKILLLETQLNFNSIMTSEDASEDTASLEEEPEDDDIDSHVSYGLNKIKQFVMKRYEKLKEEGNLKAYKYPENPAAKLDYNDRSSNNERPAPSFTWKRLYQAAVTYLDQQKSSKLRAIGESELGRLASSSSSTEMASFALKALLPYTLDFSVLQHITRSKIEYEEWLYPLIYEQICLKCSTWSLRSFAPLVGSLSDPLLTYWILSQEFDPWNRDAKTEDEIMHKATSRFIEIVGPLRAFCAVLEYAGISSKIQPSELSLEDDIYRVLRMEESNDPGQGLRPVLRAFLILLLHQMKSSTRRMISELFGLRSRRPIIQDLITKLLKASLSQSDATGEFSELLLAIVRDPTKPSLDRIQAAWILTDAGIEVSKDKVCSIPNFPRPWTGAVPLPQNVRESILRHYAKDAEAGTDMALLLEATLLPEEKYEDYDASKPFEDYCDGIRIIGPYSAGELHHQGGGTYNVYKVYIEPHKVAERPGIVATPYSTAAISACTFGPFARLTRNDGCFYDNGSSYGGLYIENRKDIDKIYESEKLPTYDEAASALRKWADQYGYEILSDEVLGMTFEGLNVYFFGRREPLSVADLLFYWQD